jgi:hypothetical protein
MNVCVAFYRDDRRPETWRRVMHRRATLNVLLSPNAQAIMNSSARPKFRITLWGAFGVLTIVGILCAMAYYLGGAVGAAREAARRMSEANHIKNLALALHNYHDQNKQLPLAIVRDPQGAPFTSWRVGISPYLMSDPFYNQYDRAQPWNSPANDALCRSTLWEVFRAPGVTNSDEACTNFVMPTGAGTIGECGRRFNAVKDGSDKTILVLALKSSDILWYEPRDLDLCEITRAPGDPQRILIRGKLFQETLCAFCDGRVAMLPADLDYDNFMAMLSIAGGERVDLSWEH